MATPKTPQTTTPGTDEQPDAQPAEQPGRTPALRDAYVLGGNRIPFARAGGKY
ncbi:acetyl-CoA C-acyltransferase, partial [Actinotalea fermentans ATCC 43279 = JCM 9966 = DSM 3133]